MNKKFRKEDEGNRLWELYCELGKGRRKEFLHYLNANGILYYTFLKDSQSTIKLNNLKVWRVELYAKFFKLDMIEFLQPVPKENI